LRYATIILTATVLATVAALSVSVLEPKRAEAGSAVRACGGKTIQLNAKEARTFSLHNRVRKNHGLRPLCIHPKLTRAARAHSADMIRKDYFAHGSGLGSSATITTGVPAARTSAGDTVLPAHPGRSSGDGWTAAPTEPTSSERRFREVGIGIATGKYKGHKGYTTYTVDFGTRR
jgi:hypothetical protein